MIDEINIIEFTEDTIKLQIKLINAVDIEDLDNFKDYEIGL